MCIISICSILILLSILRSVTQSYVHPLHMKTQFSKLLTNVGDYASISLQSTDTLKSGMVNASWVSTVTDNKQTVTHNPHSFPWGFILEESTKDFLMNGWKNYETWNVSLWIQNDEHLYKLALMSAGFQSFMNDMHGWDACMSRIHVIN